MTTFEVTPETRLSQLWDDLIAGANGPDPLDADAVFVSDLHRQMDLPYPSPAIEDAIWAAVMTATVAGIATTSPAEVSAKSGVTLWTRLVLALPTFAWLILAGLLGGFIAGVSSRLMMRVSGLLTVSAHRFIRTDADAQVGHITFAGTMFLGALGAAAGVLAVCFYLAIRSRLPFEGKARSAVFAGILLAVFGYVLMDPTNHDYHTFGPAWLNVFNFSSLYLIMGFACAELYEAQPQFFSTVRQGQSRIVSWIKTPLFVIISLFGAYLAVFVMLLGWKSLIIPFLALVGWAIARTGIQRNLSFFSMPIVIRQWGIWVVPGIVGFTLTARGVTEILLNR